MITRRTIMRSGIALGAVTLVGPELARQAAAATTLKGYTYLPAVNKPGAAGLESMGQEISDKTDGALSLELNLGGSLPIKGSDITQAVGDGVIDLAGNGFFHGSVPVGGVLRLPMLMTSYEHFFTARDIAMPAMESGFADQGVTVLGAYVYPPQVAWSRERLESLDDLRDKKMRVTSAEQGAFVERFGGVPVTIPTAEVTPALQRGVVDGVFTASIGGGIFWRDLLNYNYRLGVSFFDSVIIINSDVFEGLSAEEQQILRDAGTAAGEAITQQMIEEEPATTRELADGGMTIVEPTAEEVSAATAAMGDYWTEWAKDKDEGTAEVLAAVRSSLGV